MSISRKPDLASVFFTAAAVLSTGCDRQQDPHTGSGPVPNTVTLDVDIASTPPRPCSHQSEHFAGYKRLELGRAHPQRPQFSGGGAAVADLNGDGRVELLISDADAVRVWSEVHGQWLEMTEPVPSSLSSGAAGLYPMDANGDGATDLLITRYGHPDVLLFNTNEGEIRFETTPWISPFPDPSQGAAWVDLDDDEDLDLIIANFGTPDFSVRSPRDLAPSGQSRFYLQTAPGTFDDFTPKWTDLNPNGEYTFAILPLDLDGRAPREMYYLNDFGSEREPNRLMAWDPATLSGTSLTGHGLDLPLDTMSATAGDLNGDLILDLVLSSWGECRVLESNTDHHMYIDTTSIRGLSNIMSDTQHIAWGNQLADLDNDGDLDLVTMFGELDTEGFSRSYPGQPDGLFLNEGGRFTAVQEEIGLREGFATRGVVVADVNRDGTLDILRPTLDGAHTLLLGVCTPNHWVSFDLRQPGPNPEAIGARLVLTAGEASQLRVIEAGGATYNSMGATTTHFGLGPRATPFSLQLVWPDGAVSSLTDLEADRHYQITRNTTP